MKLSQLEGLTKSLRSNANERGLVDPEINFWEISAEFAGSFKEFDFDASVFEVVGLQIFCCKPDRPDDYSLPIRVTRR